MCGVRTGDRQVRKVSTMFVLQYQHTGPEAVHGQKNLIGYCHNTAVHEETEATFKKKDVKTLMVAPWLTLPVPCVAWSNKANLKISKCV